MLFAYYQCFMLKYDKMGDYPSQARLAQQTREVGVTAYFRRKYAYSDKEFKF